MRPQMTKADRCRSLRYNRRYETCIACGQTWNVSTLAKIPWYGYVCPRCRSRKEKT